MSAHPPTPVGSSHPPCLLPHTVGTTAFNLQPKKSPREMRRPKWPNTPTDVSMLHLSIPVRWAGNSK